MYLLCALAHLCGLGLRNLDLEFVVEFGPKQLTMGRVGQYRFFPKYWGVGTYSRN